MDKKTLNDAMDAAETAEARFLKCLSNEKCNHEDLAVHRQEMYEAQDMLDCIMGRPRLTRVVR